MIQKNCVNSCLVAAFEALLNCSNNCACNEVDGCITLNQGNHEITVKTDVVPSVVFLSVLPIGTPVCNGNIDMVGSSLLPDGFVLYANIMSNSAEVCYLVQA